MLFVLFFELCDGLFFPRESGFEAYIRKVSFDFHPNFILFVIFLSYECPKISLGS